VRGQFAIVHGKLDSPQVRDAGDMVHQIRYLKRTE
jgi:hypothetical protein